MLLEDLEYGGVGEINTTGNLITIIVEACELDRVLRAQRIESKVFIFTPISLACMTIL